MCMFSCVLGAPKTMKLDLKDRPCIMSLGDDRQNWGSLSFFLDTMLSFCADDEY